MIYISIYCQVKINWFYKKLRREVCNTEILNVLRKCWCIRLEQ